jgi:hypothetical protein
VRVREQWFNPGNKSPQHIGLQVVVLRRPRDARGRLQRAKRLALAERNGSNALVYLLWAEPGLPRRIRPLRLHEGGHVIPQAPDRLNSLATEAKCPLRTGDGSIP